MSLKSPLSERWPYHQGPATPDYRGSSRRSLYVQSSFSRGQAREAPQSQSFLKTLPKAEIRLSRLKPKFLTLKERLAVFVCLSFTRTSTSSPTNLNLSLQDAFTDLHFPASTLPWNSSQSHLSIHAAFVKIASIRVWDLPL